jgi:hypothetical protein
MGRLMRRLRYLEERARPWGTREQLLLDRALAQMETEDLHVLRHYLDRGGEEYAEPTEEEAEVISRLEEHLNE